jgi:acyl-CoA synthetase (AMP-forming)/AMP-acid ligase II
VTAPVITDRDGMLDAPGLEDRVAAVAGGLLARGIGPGDTVLVLTRNDRDAVVALHAVIRSGATAALSQDSAGASEHRAAEAATRPALVLPAAELVAVHGAALTGPVDPDPDRAQVVVFTSGTTSVPKGVVHTGRSLAATVANVGAMAALGTDDSAFLVSPFASITGVTQTLALAAVGGGLVLEPAYDDERSLDLLLETGATFYGGPDLVLDRLLQAADRRGVAVPLRTAALGGTMLRRDLLDRAESAGVRVIRVYGSSEVPWSTGTRRSEPAEVRLTDEGTPGPGVEIRLADDGTGELLLRGPHLFAGYTDAAATAAALEDGWFRTGDEATVQDGRLRIVGRLKDVASRNGKKVSLAEVDEAFAAASGIRDCAAFAVPDDTTGERVVIAVRADTPIDVPAALAAMEAAGLARFKLPERVVRWPGPLPTTATGKVQRRDLTEDSEVLWQAPRLD